MLSVPFSSRLQGFPADLNRRPFLPLPACGERVGVRGRFPTPKLLKLRLVAAPRRNVGAAAPRRTLLSAPANLATLRRPHGPETNVEPGLSSAPCSRGAG